MSTRGKFIVLEGIDGSGKRTQLEMLARALSERHVPLSQISFPRYEGFFGKLVGAFSERRFRRRSMPWTLTSPRCSMPAIATKQNPKSNPNSLPGSTVLADRYIGSNLAHQGARVRREDRGDFIQWLKKLEYEIYSLPEEDLVIYLRVPVAEAHRLVGQKGARDYTKLRRDILESDIAHLEAAAEVYDQLAQQPNWVRIECFDAKAGALRSPDAIHAEILGAIETRFLKPQGATR